jgi:MFS family permease
VALAASSLIGGLSGNVPTYLIAAVLLGVFFAMYSGTVDAIVYDMVVEETGTSDEFERRIGRMRAIESGTLAGSALLAGWLAELTSPRLMYFLTVPFVVASVGFYLRFTEPVLHKATEAGSPLGDLAGAVRAMRRGALLPIVALAIMAAMLESVIIEFGPLWLVALAAPAVLFGPYWAGLMSSFGFGGMVAGRLNLTHGPTIGAVVAAMVGSGVLLTVSVGVLVVTLAQIVLVLLVTVVAIHVSKLVHDAVPSSIRTGVASGISALSWLVFLPFALVFGVITKYHGVHAAGWMIAGAAILAGLLLIKAGRAGHDLCGAGRAGHRFP